MASEKNLYGKAQKGNSAAFYEWAETIQPDSGRFAYQLGVSIEVLPDFQRQCLQLLFEEIGGLAQEQAQLQLFKIMVKHYSTYTAPLQTDSNQAILGFPEDNELHSELQKLESDQKIPLVLAVFHNCTKTDIATVMGMPESQATRSVEQGLATLEQTFHYSKQQLLLRLEMLQKSYRRFEPPKPAGLQKPIEIGVPLADDASAKTVVPRPFRRKTAVLLGGAGLFIASIIGISFMMDDQQTKTAGTTEWQQVETVTEDMMADWKRQYESVKASSPERLGMSPEQYGKLDYVKQADAEMERVFSDRAVDSLEGDPEAMQLAVEQILWQIETPRGMALSLGASHPLPSEEVNEFLRNYTAKATELQHFADNILLNYQEELETTAVMGELSPEKLRAQPDVFPEELRLLVEALPEYALFPFVDMEREHFRTVRDVNYLQQQQPFIGHPYAGQYLQMWSEEPYFNDNGFLVPLENVPQKLIFMEMALLDEWGETSLFDGTEVAYQQVFWQMMKGNDNSPVFDDQGKVKNEYRAAWNNAASSNPMAFLLLPILDEMEASGWTASAHYDELQFHDILDALEMEKAGSLAGRLPNGDLELEEEFVDLQDFDYSRINPLYESFRASYDLQILAGVPPLDVLFMYHYANEINDRDTLWHLLADSPLKPPLAAFKEQWQNIPKLTENVAWVELSKDTYKQRVKEKIFIYPHIQAEQYDERLELMLVTEKDRIWQVDYQRYESYELQGQDQQFKRTVDSLYGMISGDSGKQLPSDTDPGEVAGVFFKAIESEDIPAMRKLVAEKDLPDERFEAFLELRSFRPFSEFHQLTFKTFFDGAHSGIPTGRAEIQYEAGAQDNLYEEVLFMKKTADGWRMSELNSY
ncbi:hypothetical protein QMA04_14865 [Planococcus sp. APC 3900]|uniref:hypothetical protein n=1 Tax=Planococcus sp. APC 3900 TaxID=3035191 RepID=UPI0025B505C7|nr:hypothetical protein [Planococcus sp. APC 3900]MDN3439371.1 hypothetical protein [Planococcus sp. APC 3900]